jgi:sporulation protein YlmC with PRC-barrel domain
MHLNCFLIYPCPIIPEETSMKCLTAAALLIMSFAPPFAQAAAPGTDSSAQAETPSPPATPASNFVTHQTQDQWLVGNVWNKRVYNTAGQSVGDVKDILITRDGKVVAIVIGVGGFLGLGEKNVAVSFDLLQKNGNIASDRIILNMDEQALRAAPDFQRIKPSAAQTPGSK